jgi:hypothetical protein
MDRSATLLASRRRIGKLTGAARGREHRRRRGTLATTARQGDRWRHDAKGEMIMQLMRLTGKLRAARRAGPPVPLLHLIFVGLRKPQSRNTSGWRTQSAAEMPTRLWRRVIGSAEHLKHPAGPGNHPISRQAPAANVEQEQSTREEQVRLQFGSYQMNGVADPHPDRNNR